MVLRASDKPHILDLILSDEKFISHLEYISPVCKSSHVVLSFDCELGITSCNNSHKFNFMKGDYDQLRLFMDRNWIKEFELLGDGGDDVWNYFKSELEPEMKMYIPMCTRPCRRRCTGPCTRPCKGRVHSRVTYTAVYTALTRPCARPSTPLVYTACT